MTKVPEQKLKEMLEKGEITFKRKKTLTSDEYKVMGVVVTKANKRKMKALEQQEANSKKRKMMATELDSMEEVDTDFDGIDSEADCIVDRQI